MKYKKKGKSQIHFFKKVRSREDDVRLSCTYFGIPGREEGTEAMFKEILAESLPEIMKVSKIQEAR